MFPQLEAVEGQHPIYGADRLSPDVFQCQGDRDRFRSEPLAVKIEYHATSGVIGWFGIATPKDTNAEKGYDVDKAGFTKICFWVYTEQPDQAFYLRMKDRHGLERQVEPSINIKLPDDWREVCTSLSRFSDMGVDLSQMENVNLGFTESAGSATIWVDDFEFRR